MPVTITTEPDEVSYLSDCVKFGLTLSDGGTSPIVKSTVYTLECDGGTLTDPEFIPYTGAEEFFNPVSELSKCVDTALPDISASGVFEDTDIIKSYVINYGESQLNTETCETTNDLTNTSDTKYILASRPEFFNIEDLTGSTPVILTMKPERMSVVEGQFDYVYVYKYSGVLSWRFEFRGSDNGALGASAGSAILDKQVYGIPCGPGNGAFPSIPAGTAYYDLNIYNGTTIEANLFKTYRFLFSGVDCLSLDESGYAELFFQEPLGGFSVIRFQDVKTQGSLTSSIYEKKVESCDPATLAANYGDTTYNVINRKIYNLSTEIEYTAGLDRYLDACIASKKHFVRVSTRSGTDVLAKVNLNNGSYQTLNDSENVSFNLSLTSHVGVKY